MNFKTTIVLIILLAVASAALYFSQDRDGAAISSDPTASNADGEKLIILAPDDVTKLSITPQGGSALTLEKSEGKWKLAAPVSAPADAFTVDELVKAVVNLQSRGTVDATEEMGLATPAFEIVVNGKDDKRVTLAIGNKSAVGDVLYVAKDGQTSQAHIVSASLIEQLEKPATDYRRKQLVELASAEIKQIEVNRAGGKLVLHRVGNDWQVVSPTAMPAEAASVTDLIGGATGMRAEEFVSESAGDEPKYQLDQPQVSVTLSTIAPATQPATTPASQPAGKTITLKLGRFADVMKKNVYASTSDAESIVTVPASSLEKFNVPAVTLRDRKVLDIDPAQSSKIVIQSDLAATTQPTTRPASQNTITLDRRNEDVALGPTLTTAPVTQPATAPATTEPAATQPATTQAAATTVAASTAPAPSKWQLASTTQPTDASDARVDTILASLHPLRATKYIEAAPTTQPAATYTLTVTAIAPGGAAPQTHIVKLTDAGTSGPLIGEANGLFFEVDRSLLTKLEGEFTRGSTAPVSSAPQELPPELPGFE